VGRHGWILVRLGGADAAEMRELFTEALRMTAPERLVTQFDAAAG
jgi:hypothetical protein